MPGRSYANFDLLIEGAEQGYQARVLASPAGEAKVAFELPFSSEELRGLLPRLAWPRRGRPLRRPSPIRDSEVRRFGATLFRTVFAGAVEGCLRRSLLLVAQQEKGLRLRLRLSGVPELAGLPWEYLCDPQRDFLNLSAETPIVRYLEIGRQVRPLQVEPPLRVLVVIANPQGTAPLDVDLEWSRIQSALAVLSSRGLLTLERLEPPTLGALNRRLREEPCHILHFIGHGTFDRGRGEGFLAMADDTGGARPVSGQDLGSLLNERRIALAVLNACEGASHTESDAFAGVAQALVRLQVPAVIAMQAEISDAAASSFAGHFYELLASDYPVDGALSEARRAMLAAGHAGEWGTPVLYMRASDGHLFAAPGESPPSRWQRWRGGLAHFRSPFVWGPIALLLVSGLVLSQLAKKTAPPVPRSEPVPYRFVPPSDTKPISPAPAPAPKVELPKKAARAKAVPGCPSPPGTDLRFVRIEPGEFLMGANQEDRKPIHEVKITHPFCLGKFEVTERQWRQVMQGNSDPPRQPDDDLPVSVSWNEAGLFIQKLNKKVGKSIYRLPWEAEWEYSARANTITRYSFGDEASQLYQYGNCFSHSGPGDGFQDRAPVGSFKPNPFGLYDMHGNVWEWVGDWYGPYAAGPAIDPTGPPQGDKRVRRGGGYEAKSSNCESSARKGSAANFKREKYTGFRIVQILP